MRRNIILVLVLLLIIGSIFYLESLRPSLSTQPADITAKNVSGNVVEAAMFPKAKEIVNPTGFINTDNITISELIGRKVILVDFWTFLCINCQNTLPYLKSWYAKYKDQGLIIIGVHTPELPPERDPENVKAAVKRLGIEYPVVLDNNYATWNAYSNHYWPTMYLIDIDGYIVYTHIGEGAYSETEQTIQRLLLERSITIRGGSTAILSSTFQALEVSPIKAKLSAHAWATESEPALCLWV
jgi:thiol-disulfide isomerase/thioredoxin